MGILVGFRDYYWDSSQSSGTISGASENFGDFKLERLFRRRSRSSECLFLEICRFFGFRTPGFVFALWAFRLVSGILDSGNLDSRDCLEEDSKSCAEPTRWSIDLGTAFSKN